MTDALLRALSQRGTKRIWGVPGGGSSLDLIAAAPHHGIHFVLCRHEGAAAMAALADAELTGAPGVVLTTKGPGVGNAVNGLACATLERAPLLLVSDGFSATQADWVTHQFFDQRAATAAVAKGYARCDSNDPVAEIEALLNLACAAPRGAVHLDLTGQAARRQAEPKDFAPPAPLPPDPAALDAARALLAGARKPVVIAGLEAAEASEALRALVTALGCPVLVTCKAKGCVADADPHCVGVFTGGSLEANCVGEADLILLAGLDPVELIPQPWRYTAPVLDIGLRPHPVHYIQPAVGLHGDLGASLAALAADAAPSAWLLPVIGAHGDAMRAALAWAGSGGVAPPRVVQIAREEAGLHAGQATAPRATVDAGAHTFSATAFWACAAPRDLLISNGLASMGFALPAGIAAALHDPARGAIAFTGDGGLMMCLGELATAFEARARLVTIVFNDAALSLIDIKQQHRQLLPEGVRWGRVDFCTIAEGMGVLGLHADTEEMLREALAVALAFDGPSLIDVQVDPAGYPAQLQALRG
ncbi:thiamine pyrophosphate-binding protein [Humitalea sp. 24SJ18S-53]|uniref:thiamine pyrophosphate-binding protein n=1 Tax=Humitalea sp. 24SJ18S-53 TaxID=3422307 RepID=UPI003D6776AA